MSAFKNIIWQFISLIINSIKYFCPKIIKITAVSWLVLFLGLKISYASLENPVENNFYQILSGTYELFFQKYIPVDNEKIKLQQEFETEVKNILFGDKILSSEEEENFAQDMNLIENYLSGNLAEEDLLLVYDQEIKGSLKISEIVKEMRLLIDATNLSTDEVNIILSAIYQDDWEAWDSLDGFINKYVYEAKDPLKGVYALFSIMEKYINIEKKILVSLNPQWENELETINNESVFEALNSIKEYDLMVEEFAMANNFTLRDFKSDFLGAGLDGMKFYGDFQKSMADDLGMEYEEVVFEGIGGMKKYGEWQEEFLGEV